jgi:hypothetical protein
VAIEPKNGRRTAVTSPQDLWKKFQTVALEEEKGEGGAGGLGTKEEEGKEVEILSFLVLWGVWQ